MKTIDSIAYRDFSCPVTLSIVGPWKEEKNLSFVEVKIFTRCAISMLDFYAMNSGWKIVQKHKKTRASNIKYVKNISFLFIRKNLYAILKLHIMYSTVHVILFKQTQQDFTFHAEWGYENTSSRERKTFEFEKRKEKNYLIHLILSLLLPYRIRNP